jgi:hypothetical protein
MTIAEQIKAAFTALLPDFKAAVAPAATTPVADLSAIADSAKAEILEPVQKELATAKTELVTAQETIKTLTAAAEAKDKEIATLKATIADPKGKIETVASTKAQEIAAAQGVPAIPATPTAGNPAAPAKPETKLTGRARVEAAIAAELNTTFPAKPGAAN